MTLGLLFWVLVILALVFNGASISGHVSNSYMWGGNLFAFLLIIILGWQVFGPPLKRGAPNA